MMLTALKIIFAMSLISIVYSYAIYPALLMVLSTFFSRPVRKSSDCLPAVAVIIPAYNEERIIRTKIGNVLSLDYPRDRLTVWVGSDCSGDQTEAIVRSLDDERVHLWVAGTRGGKTQILNNLIPEVDAAIVLLTDANTMHRPSSLRMLVRSFDDSTVGAVAGHIEHAADKGRSGEETLYRSFETWQKRMESSLHSTISAFGGFYAVRRELYRPIPYNSYSNDDVLIPMNVIRQGFRVIFDEEAVSYEDMTESAKLEFRRRVRIGAGNFQAFFRLLDFVNPFKGWPSFCYLSHKASRWFSPIFIITAYVSSGILCVYAPVALYKIIFAAGVAALAAGVLGGLLRISALRPLYYFFLMNAALLLGLLRYCGGIRSATWSRTERQA